MAMLTLLIVMFQSLDLRESCKEPSSALQKGLLQFSWEMTVGLTFVVATFCTASDCLSESKACPETADSPPTCLQASVLVPRWLSCPNKRPQQQVEFGQTAA